MRKAWTWILLLAMVTATAYCVDERIKPDRPDFTEGTDVVPLGQIQLEMGFLRSYANGSWFTSLSETVLRSPLSRKHELLFELPSVSWQDREREIEHGSIAHKWVLPGSTEAFSRAFIAGVQIPSGGEGRAWLPSALFAAEWEPKEGLSFGANMGWEVEEDHSWFTLSTSIEKELTDRITGILEWNGNFPSSRDEEDRQLINGGLIYFVNNSVAFDISGGFNLRTGLRDYFFGMGVSTKW